MRRKIAKILSDDISDHQTKQFLDLMIRERIGSKNLYFRNGIWDRYMVMMMYQIKG